MLPVLLLACSSDGTDTAADGSSAPPYAVLQEQGFDRYLGVFSPSESESNAQGDVSDAFTDPSGPTCMNGRPFYTTVRDQGSDDLVFFLQGGGMCYSELCLAVSSASPGIPGIEILDPDKETNPVRDWNMVYVPYCDGSLFTGDAVYDDDGDGELDRIHHGLMNLSAAIDTAQRHFPTPRRIFLAGSSGGGYGTFSATVLARLTWPDADIYLFNDAGVGLGRDGEPDFIWTIINEFNAAELVPSGQVDLLDGGHITPLTGWALQQDPRLKVAAYSTYNDYVISQMYLQAAPDDFADWLEQELGAVHAAHPERAQYFLADGLTHTTLLGDPSGFMSENSQYYELISSMLGGIDSTEVSGVTISAWIEAMLAEDGSWQSVAD